MTRRKDCCRENTVTSLEQPRVRVGAIDQLLSITARQHIQSLGTGSKKDVMMRDEGSSEKEVF
jgi:hypothetical protein